MLGRADKREVLELIAERTKDGEGTSFRDVARGLLISEDAACSHLKRLWRARLIKSDEDPSSFWEALPGTSIRDLGFRLTRRGKERLQWWEDKRKERRWFG